MAIQKETLPKNQAIKAVKLLRGNTAFYENETEEMVIDIAELKHQHADYNGPELALLKEAISIDDTTEVLFIRAV